MTSRKQQCGPTQPLLWVGYVVTQIDGKPLSVTVSQRLSPTLHPLSGPTVQDQTTWLITYWEDAGHRTWSHQKYGGTDPCGYETPPKLWPPTPSTDRLPLPEARKPQQILLVDVQEPFILFSKFSSYTKLLRTTGWILHFTKNLHSQQKQHGDLTASELTQPTTPHLHCPTKEFCSGILRLGLQLATSDRLEDCPTSTVSWKRHHLTWRSTALRSVISWRETPDTLRWPPPLYTVIDSPYSSQVASLGPADHTFWIACTFLDPLGKIGH